jgi:hypothetical protein
MLATIILEFRPFKIMDKPTFTKDIIKTERIMLIATVRTKFFINKTFSKDI